MAKRNGFVIDKRLAEGLSGPEKLKALIIARFGTMRAFAGEHGLWPIRLSQELTGERRDPQLRRRMAEALDLPPEEVDALLDDGADKEQPTGTGG